ncbi:Endonuclease/exonuclease/phosphatase [Fimicolochytrium jonesii]|uniref:Endonuclease/exonuclease/phosphatase n=1 Tax=Fimicolochytrium jonesii TaxID=1396493 RepID=UPI0022FE60D8|nr:Endonuclease/exonuclease/phosphatase [Fimicolochytrium jonesii]KAI8826137.1 Endonuclease/exonuclease/phosphatase [Fimicolochytrium jonesii]
MHSYRFTNDAWRPAPPLSNLTESKSPDAMRILTYNVCFKGGTVFDPSPTDRSLFDHRMSGLLTLLRDHSADIICLQEVTGRGLQILLSDPFVRGEYYTTDATGRTLGRYGVVILSRLPMEGVEIYPLPTGMGRNLLCVTVCLSASARAVIATVHLDSLRDSAPVRKEQVLELDKVLGMSEGYQFSIVCGDFNFSNPDEDLAFVGGGWKDAWLTVRGLDAPGHTIGVNYPSDKYPPARFDRFYWKAGSHPTYEMKGIAVFGDTVMELGGGSGYVSDHLGVRLNIEKISGEDQGRNDPKSDEHLSGSFRAEYFGTAVQ